MQVDFSELLDNQVFCHCNVIQQKFKFLLKNTLIVLISPTPSMKIRNKDVDLKLKMAPRVAISLLLRIRSLYKMWEVEKVKSFNIQTSNMNGIVAEE